VDPISFEVFSPVEIYAGALSNAQEWNSDADLLDARFPFRLTSDAEGRWAALEFRSPSYPRERLNVFVTEASDGLEYKLSPVQHEGDEPLDVPITREMLAIDAGEAREISLLNGGYEYIQGSGRFDALAAESLFALPGPFRRDRFDHLEGKLFFPFC
jgi:hypothetical protein